MSWGRRRRPSAGMIYVESARSLKRQQNGQMRICPKRPRLKMYQMVGFWMGGDQILRKQQHQGRVSVRVTVFSWRYKSWSKIKEAEDKQVYVHIRSGGVWWGCMGGVRHSEWVYGMKWKDSRRQYVGGRTLCALIEGRPVNKGWARWGACVR